MGHISVAVSSFILLQLVAFYYSYVLVILIDGTSIVNTVEI